MVKELLLEMVRQNKATCDYAFRQITTENSNKKLNPDTASIGYIYRHIGETLNLFGTFFGIPTEIQNTTMGHTDEGKFIDLETSREMVSKGFNTLEDIVNQSTDDIWLKTVDTPFFGTISRIRLFSHVLYHNSHHAGQISLTLKRGR